MMIVVRKMVGVPFTFHFYFYRLKSSFQRTLKHPVPIPDLPAIVTQTAPVQRPRQTLVEILP